MLDVKFTHFRLDQKMRGSSKRANNSRPLMEKIKGDMLDDVEENFNLPGRQRWPSLSDATKEIRAAAGHTGKMLQRSGQLAASISGQTTNKTAIVGSNKEYAKYIQFGTEQKVTAKQSAFMRIKFGINMPVGKELVMPARPFLKLTPEDINAIERRVKKYFSGKPY